MCVSVETASVLAYTTLCAIVHQERSSGGCDRSESTGGIDDGLQAIHQALEDSFFLIVIAES